MDQNFEAIGVAKFLSARFRMEGFWMGLTLIVLHVDGWMVGWRWLRYYGADVYAAYEHSCSDSLCERWWISFAVWFLDGEGSLVGGA